MKFKKSINPGIENKFSGICELCDGSNEVNFIGYISFLKDGNYHREDGPARIWADGDCEYYLSDIFQKEEYRIEYDISFRGK